MKKQILFITSLFFITTAIKAQTFFTEDFNSYPTGHLNTVYDNTTPGQGGWLVSRNSTSLATGIVTAEAGKGNVLTITTNSTSDGYGFKQDDGFLATLWNNRTPGNNILKFEYEFYGVGPFGFSGHILPDSPSNATIINTAFQSIYNINRIGGGYFENTSTGSKSLILKNYNATTFPYNMWIKAEMFVDYNTGNVYYYLPTLNIQSTASFSHNVIPFSLVFSAGSLSASSVVKVDNIKVSGLKTLPSYILSTNEQLAAKFNLYPNPATNIVNITNAENMQVQQATIYDINGKQLSTHAFNNETQIQLNVENLASGTYMLHLQTNEGTAVKKLVKK